MDENSKAVLTLCCQTKKGDVKPLTTSEWHSLSKRLDDLSIEPKDMLDLEKKEDLPNILKGTGLDPDRISSLNERTVGLFFEISEFENKGISVVTIYDREYPKNLRDRLGRYAPPFFYCAGDTSLFNLPCVGYVGSRSIDDNDLRYLKKMVNITCKQGYCVVSGGARGVDSDSANSAIENGMPAIEFVSDSMNKKLKDPKIISQIQCGKRLIASFVRPDATFNVGNAMNRNKFIYAQSEMTVIIRSDLEKGGTWAGATEDLKNHWCPVVCRDEKSYPGNQALIRMGAIPLSNDIVDAPQKDKSVTDRMKNKILIKTEFIPDTDNPKVKIITENHSEECENFSVHLKIPDESNGMIVSPINELRSGERRETTVEIPEGLEGYDFGSNIFVSKIKPSRVIGAKALPSDSWF